MIQSWEDFIKIAMQVSQETGYPLSVLLGQAAQETGRNVAGAPGNNFFGIKGQGNAGTQLLWTWEDYGRGRVNVQDYFAVYATPQDAVKAYIGTIERLVPDWRKLANDPVRLVQAIKSAGYATDPAYVQNVVNTPEFKTYSQITPTPTPKQNRGIEEEAPSNFPFSFVKPVQASDATMTPLEGPKTQIGRQIVQGAGRNAAEDSTSITARNWIDKLSPKQSKSTGATSANTAARPQNYTVQQGDTLWGIAERTLGSGQRWKELGGYKGDPKLMPIGTKISIPTASRQTQSSAPAGTQRGPMSTNKGPVGGMSVAPKTSSPARKTTPTPSKSSAPFQIVSKSMPGGQKDYKVAVNKSSPIVRAVMKKAQGIINSIGSSVKNLFKR